ncbi:heterokaryon incompatibility protein-domain-containing protein [Podospora aff. communis PSN243]|uniref:Heterokaryon incompatibility protein-domain-containing protein n=1 Tax=Podospora aff. communis PSN243 TaxID=3040156 RepID=A0AAV9GV44_9PEZI|nr:heterokaryon incompatibility protein-domain-containing protein [Podospora aff. communis PSN243]
MPPFHYPTSLRNSAPSQTIRLLDLHPGTPSSPLSCTLREISLLSSPRPQYNAISYCWGGQTPSLAITCNSASLLITANLHDALCRFRSEDEVVSLWADAVCINQADLDEKSAQVPLMGVIYRSAREVWVWLGDVGGVGDGAEGEVAALAGFAGEMEGRFGMGVWDLVRSSEPGVRRAWRAAGMVEGLMGYSEEGWRGLLGLLGSPWWQRVWVVQEVALASGRVWLHWGTELSRASWEDVVAAFLCWGKISSLGQMAAMDDVQCVLRLEWTRETVQRGGVGVMWLLHSNTSALATDARDMVCGMLGMAPMEADGKTADPFIFPDYRVDVAVFYQRVMEKLLSRFPKFYALSSLGLGVETPGGRVPNLPSWVVDWTTPRIARNSPNATDAAKSDKKFEYGTLSTGDPCLTNIHPKIYKITGNVLTLSGFIIDQVSDTTNVMAQTRLTSLMESNSSSPMIAAGHILATQYTAIQTWQYPSLTTYPPTGEDSLQAVIATIHRGRPPKSLASANAKHLLREYFRFSKHCSYLRSSLTSHYRLLFSLGMGLITAVAVTRVLAWAAWRRPKVEHVTAFRDAGSWMVDQTPFRTQGGLIGISHSLHLQKGDCVALVRGGVAPLVLRPAEGGTWRIVGEAYVHGVMNGEMFDVDKCRDICII